MVDLLSGGGSAGRFRALLRLNLILAWRPTKSGKVSNVIGSLLFLGLFGLLGLILFGVGLGFALKLPSRLAEVRLLAWGGAALFAFYLFIALFKEGLGGGDDPSLLFHAPITPTQHLLAELAARIAGPLVLPPLGFFIGCVFGIAFSGRPVTALFVLPATVLWLFQVFLFLTVADYLLFNLRRSRRFTELVWLIMVLLFTGWMGLQVWLGNGGVNPVQYTARSLLSRMDTLWPAIEKAAFFIPGISPVAWLSGGLYGAAVFLATAGETTLLLLFGGYLLRRLMESGGAAAHRKHKPAVVAPVKVGVRPWTRLAFWPFSKKEFHSILRDPYLKMMIINVLMGPLILLLVFSTPTTGGFSIRVIEYGVPLLLLLYMGPFLFNNLGLERDGLTTLVTAPFPRWRLFAGKNVFYLLFYFLLLAPLTGVLIYKGVKAPVLIADWACYIPLALIFMGAGNLISIYMPIPMVPVGKRLRPSLPKGKIWLFSLMRSAAQGVLVFFALPLLLGRAALVAFGDDFRITPVVIFAMLAYGALLYGVQLIAAARLMPAREPVIFELLLRSQG